MSREVNVTVTFDQEFKGELVSANESTIQVGQDAIRPYDMLMGALVSCFHHTFLEIVGKKRQRVAHVEYRVHGRKRETTPTMLEYVRLDVIVTGGSDVLQIEKSFELSKKYCSVYQTLSHVATIEVNITHQTE